MVFDNLVTDAENSLLWSGLCSAQRFGGQLSVWFASVNIYTVSMESIQRLSPQTKRVTRTQ